LPKHLKVFSLMQQISNPEGRTASNSPWFATEAIDGGITRLWEPFVHRFFRANIFHVVGQHADLVVDFGMGIASVRQKLAIPGKKPVLAVATHSHVDHIGSFHEFSRRMGHGAEAKIFATADERSTMAHLFREQRGALTRLPGGNWRLEDFALKPAPLTDILSDGDRLDLGDGTFLVMHLPGHSMGSIGLLDQKNGVLFCGDAIYRGRLVDDLPGSDRTMYRKTMALLCDLDVKSVFGGHGEPIKGAEMRAIARQYLERSAGRQAHE
jgi:glyoxylase-like metal-dependent hydrolase (beta-lactamase superfamily II)